MLGRLRMAVQECIEAYTALSHKVFEKQGHRLAINGKLQGRFDETALEQVVKCLLRQRGLGENALLQDSPDATCKV